MGDTWHHQERPIGITEIRGSSGVDSNPTVRSSSHRGWLEIVRSPSDGHDDSRASSHPSDRWNALER